jgi:DNA mismatch repair protein MutL
VSTAAVARHIALLDPTVANAIAAGEVVERPASVVKELCENAIDAGATSINVEIADGGMTRISVIDDGGGISADDLELAVARHATSKITSVDDLSSIATLGFRGEALASMAAVSQLTIRSATAATTAGRELTLRAGVAVGDQPTPAVAGTTVELVDLFFNTPARLQFLKSPKTEAARAVRVISDLALTRPEIRFSCRVDERTLLRTSGESLQSAIASVFGSADAESMIAVDSEGEVAISGYVGQPYRHRGQRNAMVTIVNGRRVHNRALTFAVENAFRSLIPTGRFPVCVLGIDVPPQMLDVNVHPAKAEVRFANEGMVFAAIERACWSALSGVTIAPRESVVLPGQSFTRPEMPLQFSEPKPPGYSSVSAPPIATDSGASLQHLAPLRALGQVNDRWIAAATSSGMVVVDPHAAHEKLVYTKLMTTTGNEDAQLLLMPVVVELTPSQMAQVAASTDALKEWGIEIEEFGPSSVSCRAVPASAAKADIATLIPLLIDELTDGRGDDAKRKHKAAALVACHSAVRLGDRLGLEEQQALLDQLVEVPTATTCPHGRPTVFVLDDQTLRRAFDRPAI